MVKNKIGNRYAKAIYEVAEEKGRVREIYEVLNNIMILYKKNLDFKNFITHPLIKTKEKTIFVDKLFLENNITKSTEDMEIVDYILDKNRISFIKNIVSEYLKIYYMKNRILKVVGIFSKELTENQKKKLEENIKKKTGKEIELTVKIDPSIIGGGIIKIDDKVTDGSVRKDLEMMKKYGEISEQEVQI
ncbi:ATP synthase F1 subunit delta [Fusobacterium sp. PH5-44]|uniref:ATP synthase F1 subunit delta n=1 Tax=unclassified Fusobacterium TaxID=2648384 RepID=UPI003D2530A7